jgi:hypothetical protein
MLILESFRLYHFVLALNIFQLIELDFEDA